MIVALAGIGTAVTLYPVLKRQNEGVALGFVSLRVLEAATIYSGIGSLLSIVTLRQEAAGTLAIGQALAAQYYSTFLFGQSLIPAGNALLLGYVLYKSRLLPRALPVLAFIGAPLLIASWAGTLVGLIEPVSPASAVMALPIALWEFSLGLYLIIKGFKSFMPKILPLIQKP